MKIIKIEDLPTICPPNHYNLKVRRIADASIGAKTMVTALTRMASNGNVDPHTHENTEHLFIVLKGELGVKTSQGEIRVKPGEAVFIYPGELHGNFNAGGGDTEYIAVTCNINP